MKGLFVYVVSAWFAYIAGLKYIFSTWSEHNHSVIIVVLATTTLSVLTITELFRVNRNRIISLRRYPIKQNTY